MLVSVKKRLKSLAIKIVHHPASIALTRKRRNLSTPPAPNAVTLCISLTGIKPRLGPRIPTEQTPSMITLTAVINRGGDADADV
jgi:hypothetical protein